MSAEKREVLTRKIDYGSEYVIKAIPSRHQYQTPIYCNDRCRGDGATCKVAF